MDAPLPHAEGFTSRFISTFKQKYMNRNSLLILIGILSFAIAGVLLLSPLTKAEVTETQQKRERLAQIRKDKEDNSETYRQLAPQAAKSRGECELLDAREAQLKYLNAQNRALSDEETQLVHDLKIAGEDPTPLLK
jgi:hypothetical protein